MLSNDTQANLFILGDTSYGRFLLIECLQHSFALLIPSSITLVAAVWMRWLQNMCKLTALFILDQLASHSE